MTRVHCSCRRIGSCTGSPTTLASPRIGSYPLGVEAPMTSSLPAQALQPGQPAYESNADCGPRRLRPTSRPSPYRANHTRDCPSFRRISSRDANEVLSAAIIALSGLNRPSASRLRRDPQGPSVECTYFQPTFQPVLPLCPLDTRVCGKVVPATQAAKPPRTLRAAHRFLHRKTAIRHSRLLSVSRRGTSWSAYFPSNSPRNSSSAYHLCATPPRTQAIWPSIRALSMT